MSTACDHCLNAPYCEHRDRSDADAKPHCWQITEERKAAIQMGLDFLEYAYAKSGRGDIHEHAGQLRAMLEGVGQ